jgi:xanthine dehydrogenase YagR molybdenum-binding subunit
MYLGQDISRIDGPLKVSGHAKYAAEFNVPDLVHAVLVQSTIANGDIEGFDLRQAQGMPGVLAIITPDDAPKLKPDTSGVKQPFDGTLQGREITYSGQTVAVVVAQSFETATAAAAAVQVRYRQGEPVAVMHEALNTAYTPKNFRNGRAPAGTKIGDPDQAWSQAPIKLDVTYETPIEHHNPMELIGTIAQWGHDTDGDTLTVWTSTQSISGAQKTLATRFGLDKSKVTVLCPFVGGGFGCKGSVWPPVVLAAMAARKVGKPVKLVVTRQQMFSSNGFRPNTIQRLRLAADHDGKLLALQHDGYAQMSMSDSNEFAEPFAIASRLLYACNAIATDHKVVHINQGLPTFMRAPGEASGVYALEAAMDELAYAAKVDPLELRLRNYADRDFTENKPFASKGLRQCYEQGAEAFGWKQRTPEPRSMRRGNVLVGWGMATGTYDTSRQPAHVKVSLLPDGTALVLCGTQDLGTGTYTIMAQAAADALDLKLEQVKVQMGDSRLPPAGGSGGSTTAVSVIDTTINAARQARQKLADLAQAHGGGADPAEIFKRAGVASVDAEAAGELPKRAHDYARQSFGAQFAEVHVDADLGTIHVARWVGAFDIGRPYNAKTARSQLLGGIVFGIGQALLEETRVDLPTARYVNANIAEYLMPVNADIPDLRVLMIEAPDNITSDTGAKGIGELPTVGVAAAIANAVYHATGVRVRKLPIRIDDVI